MELKYKFKKELCAFFVKNTYVKLNYIIFDSKWRDLTLSFNIGVEFFDWKMYNRTIFNNPMGIKIKKNGSKI